MSSNAADVQQLFSYAATCARINGEAFLQATFSQEALDRPFSAPIDVVSHFIIDRTVVERVMALPESSSRSVSQMSAISPAAKSARESSSSSRSADVDSSKAYIHSYDTNKLFPRAVLCSPNGRVISAATTSNRKSSKSSSREIPKKVKKTRSTSALQRAMDKARKMEAKRLKKEQKEEQEKTSLCHTYSRLSVRHDEITTDCFENSEIEYGV